MDVRQAVRRWNTPRVRVFLVVNPTASRVTPAGGRLVEDILSMHHEVTVAETSARDHARDLALAALEQGAECVTVLAGDGTLNEVADALAGSDCMLACLPGGSTNVFSRTLGQPDDLGAAAVAVSRAMCAGQVRTIGLGSVNGRHFLLHCGIGWDAALVSVVERHAGLKRQLGHLLFAYAGIRVFFGGYDRRTPHFKVCLPDDDREQEEIDDGYFALVLNSDPYTYVHTRSLVVSPATTLEGPLTLLVVRSMRLVPFLRLVARALIGRKGLRDERWVRVRTGLDELTVTRLPERRLPAMPHQVDGDHLGEADELRFRHHPDALRIVAP